MSQSSTVQCPNHEDVQCCRCQRATRRRCSSSSWWPDSATRAPSLSSARSPSSSRSFPSILSLSHWVIIRHSATRAPSLSSARSSSSPWWWWSIFWACTCVTTVSEWHWLTFTSVSLCHFVSLLCDTVTSVWHYCMSLLYDTTACHYCKVYDTGLLFRLLGFPPRPCAGSEMGKKLGLQLKSSST